MKSFNEFTTEQIAMKLEEAVTSPPISSMAGKILGHADDMKNDTQLGDCLHRYDIRIEEFLAVAASAFRQTRD